METIMNKSLCICVCLTTFFAVTIRSTGTLIHIKGFLWKLPLATSADA